MNQNNQALLSEALALHQAGNMGDAEAMYRTILAADPQHAEALRLLGTVRLQLNHLEEGIRLLGISLEINPDQPIALNNLGNALHELKRYDDALANCDRAIALKPGYAVAYNNRGNNLHALNRHDEALESYDKAVALNPNYAEAYNNRCNILQEMMRYDEALASCEKAIALKPDYEKAYNNRGNILQKMTRYDEALGNYEKAIALKPDYASAYNNLGNALHELKRYGDALASCEKAIALQPDFAEAYNNRGNALQKLSRHDEALKSYEKAIALKPGYPEAHNNRGAHLGKLKRYEDALASCENAIALRPGYAEAHYNRGMMLQELERYDQALESYENAIALRPGYADAWNNRGTILQVMKRYEEALESYEKAIALNPNFPCLPGVILHNKMHLCHWQGIAAAFQRLIEGMEADKPVSNPFSLLSTAASAAQQKKCAEIFVKNEHPPAAAGLWNGDKYSHERIRIGYFSADFHNHPTAYLMAELFERHDRSKFEVTGFSFGPPSDHAMRKRLEKAFEHFIDVRPQSDMAIAALARSMEIDIAIDLKGFTTDSRTNIFAQRPAPVQVNYIGYPGTMAAPYIDYLIADPVLIPPEHRSFYSEKIVYMPHSYQVNDSARKIGEKKFTRREMGLPEKGFVFCCFNNNFKITPDGFDIWMRLLHRIEGSVLWLFEGNPASAKNLRAEAAARGIDAQRLVFAKRLELADHLARHRLADLFLDTFYCNAHTTASDALWAGLPVLTYLGGTFAGRVAASVLNAANLTELVTHSPAEYEALAFELATHPNRLSAIRRRLAQNQTARPLFDTARFTRHMEQAYTRMWQRSQSELPPDDIHIQDSAT